MTSFFNYRIALFGLFVLLLLVVLSCGQFSLDTQNNVFGAGISECSAIIATITSSLSSKGPLNLMGMLSLLIFASFLMRIVLRQGRSYTLGMIRQVSLYFPKYTRIILNQTQEAFRRGIIHPQIYGNVVAYI